MSPSRAAVATLKILTVAIAGLGALAASLCLAMFAALICSSATGASAALIFIPVAVGSFVAVAAALKRLGWTGRAALGALLVVCSLLMLPKPMCAADAQEHSGC